MKKLSLKKSTRSAFVTYGIVIVAYIILQSMIVTGHISSSLQGQLVPICAYIVMAISLNLVVGISGELSLGHAGFMSVGAFTGVIAAVSLQNPITLGALQFTLAGPLRLVVGMVVGGIFAAIMGVIVGVPVLRLRGDYLAIVTLAFGEIIKNIVNCLYVGSDKYGLHLSVESLEALELDEETGIAILNGPTGAGGITKLSSFTAGFILILIALFVVLNLINSRSGRAIMALRDNRIAAESVGISVTKYKLMAFITSAALAGMAGALYAMNYSTIVAKKFDFNTSILILVFVVLGGLGNIRGSIIAAAILTVLPEVLREFADYRMLVYAIVLILVMLATNNEKARQVISQISEKTIRKIFRKSTGREGL